ncbi:dihydrofolate reductase family protein [Amycolatopsis sp. NPDC088138]|uniref:dihydrofolate reductase family protein n=1 Tax=Amycolatopsis sp. NPDC088138 TaxID=3363938 RepID=UPI0037F873E9
MRRLVNSTYISLDGVIENPHHWPASGPDGGQGEAVQTELLLASDALVMGRRTYDGFAPVWPTRSGDPASDRINAMAKYVVSSTLTDPEWNNTTVIGTDPVAAIEKLKNEPGETILQYGFGQLTHALLDHGLVDEIRLWFHPLLVRGGGVSDLLFREGSLTRLELDTVTKLDSGIVILGYQVR